MKKILFVLFLTLFLVGVTTDRYGSALPAKTLVQLTTTASGTASVTTQRLDGILDSITYTGGFATGVDLAITMDGQTIWTQNDITAGTKRPVVLAQTTAGADITGHYIPIVIPDESLVFSVTNGGNATTGMFKIIVRN